MKYNTKSQAEQRLQTVTDVLALDFDKSKEFQDIVDLAAQLCNKPVALITILDESRNWLKIRSGLEVEVMPRDTSFCQHAIEQDEMLIVPDATQDARFESNPLVLSDPNIRFYAGAPLTLKSGVKLGTLCLFDSKPNEINALEQKTLAVLSRQVTYLLELELSHNQLKKQVEATEAKNEALRRIAYTQSHDIRGPLSSIMGLVNLVEEGIHSVDDEWIKMMIEVTATLDNRIKSIVTESNTSNDLKFIRFNKMVEEIEDYAILLLDGNGNVENWNKGAQIMKGYRPEEIIGKNFKNFYTKKDQENNKPNQLIELATRTGKAKDEGWRVRKDGSRFWGSITITAIHNDNNEVIGFTKVTKDLTKEKNMDEKECA